MEQKTRRPWSIFLGIWSLAAFAPAALFMPIFSRTFLYPQLPVSMQKARKPGLVEADLMLAAIGVIFLVAVVQTFWPAVHNGKRVFLPQFAVWVALGMGLVIVNLIMR